MILSINMDFNCRWVLMGHLKKYLVLMGHLKKYFSADFRLYVWITPSSEWLTETVDYQRDWEYSPRKFERILKLFTFRGKNFKTPVLDLLHARKVSQLNLWFKYAQFPRYPEFALLIPSANPLIQTLKFSDNSLSKLLILFCKVVC